MSALACLAAALLLAGPEIASVEPLPLPLGATATVHGAGFTPDATSVALADLSQKVLIVDPDQVVFLVALATPLGATTLVVTTPTGQATLAVTVVPAPPKVISFTPEPLVLGALGTAHGTGLDTVTSVHLGAAACAIQEQTADLVVFEVPLDPALLGSQPLTVDGPAGSHTRTVAVAAPPPEVDTVSPNPARQGDLVEVRGLLLSPTLVVRFDATNVPILLRTPTALTVQVHPDLPPGPHDVTADDGTVRSPPY